MTEGRLTVEPRMRRGQHVRWLAFVACLLVIGATGFVRGRVATSEPDADQLSDGMNSAVAMPGTTVATRGPLSLVLTQRGMLDCVRKTTLFSKVEWETKLTHILPEGAFVKKGDLIAELDVSKIRQEYGEEKIDVMTAETALAVAEDALILQRIENENLLAAAKLKKNLADLTLDGYKSAEYPFQVRDLERQIAAAEDALHTAQEKLAFTERLMAKGYKQSVDVDRDRLALTQAQQKHGNLVESLRVLQKHSHHRELTNLSVGAEQADRNCSRTESLAEMKLAARNMQISALRRRVLQQKQQFRWATRMLKECEIRAPHDGQVVYAPQQESSDLVGEGMRVKFLQPLIVIPDRTQMKVAVRVHETLRRLLSMGLPALIHTDADPRRSIPAKVISISQFPITGRYPNHETREYEVVVQVEEGQEDLTPGLSAKVNLVAASKDDALQVPFDAVAEVDDCYLVFVREGNRVVPHEVTLGERSQDHVEILAGLEEGARVMLDPRDRCNEALAAWEGSRREIVQGASVLGE